MSTRSTAFSTRILRFAAGGPLSSRGLFPRRFSAASAGLLALTLALPACTSTGRDFGALLTQRESPARQHVSRSSYDALIARHARENGVPLRLARAVVELESGYNAGATGRGTVGLMQIKPATARGIGYRGSAAGLYDADTNIRWGMRYLGGAYKLGRGDTCATALRYQGGHRATRASASSRAYCARLKAIMARRGG
jgi:soluble lytic murein transglycosylase-like protein